MKDEIVKKVMAILGCSFLLLFLFSVAIKASVKKELNLQTTYVAARDIPPRTQIKESDLLPITIPSTYLFDHAYRTQEDIVGKYTEIQGMIPAGSIFYKSMLFAEEAIPDLPSAQLREGQSAYTLSVDMEKLGGPIVAGQRVDIYLAIDRKEEAPISDCLFENVRIVSIKDHKGLDLADENSTGVPSFVVLAISKEDVALFNVAERIGSIRLVASSKSYETEEEAILCQDSLVTSYLQKM
ncbi:MAG: Flp pilus assembly protein CpaB [Solobacterium sp.]|nr:Flp pilus assembly protein CpaB [Solobacterium sp.]